VPAVGGLGGLLG
jgi:hypothetical protein